MNVDVLFGLFAFHFVVTIPEPFLLFPPSLPPTVQDTVVPTSLHSRGTRRTPKRHYFGTCGNPFEVE